MAKDTAKDHTIFNTKYKPIFVLNVIFSSGSSSSLWSEIIIVVK